MSLRRAKPGCGGHSYRSIDGLLDREDLIGGTSLFGGRGEIRNALIGAALISTVSNGMFILGYKTGTIFIVTGVILLLAVTFDTVVRRLQVRSGR